LLQLASRKQASVGRAFGIFDPIKLRILPLHLFCNHRNFQCLGVHHRKGRIFTDCPIEVASDFNLNLFPHISVWLNSDVCVNPWKVLVSAVTATTLQ
jgi:hypothetical protein